MEEKDVAGLVFTVGSGNQGDGGIKIEEDQFYPCVLTQIVPFENQWGPQLRWIFELEGSEYTWKSKDGKSGQFRVNGNSSKACSPKSKLYKWYSKIIGREPAEGESIALKNILGARCLVMVKINHGKDKEGNPKDYYNVDKVKLNTSTVTPTATVSAPTPTPVAPAPTPVAPAAPTPTPPSAAAPAVSNGDIFSDIY